MWGSVWWVASVCGALLVLLLEFILVHVPTWVCRTCACVRVQVFCRFSLGFAVCSCACASGFFGHARLSACLGSRARRGPHVDRVERKAVSSSADCARFDPGTPPPMPTSLLGWRGRCRSVSSPSISLLSSPLSAAQTHEAFDSHQTKNSQGLTEMTLSTTFTMTTL